MNMNTIKDIWFNGWRIFGRLFLLNLALAVFWIPFRLILEFFVPTDSPRYVNAIILAVALLVVLPFSCYYAAKWCKEFKDEIE